MRHRTNERAKSKAVAARVTAAILALFVTIVAREPLWDLSKKAAVITAGIGLPKVHTGESLPAAGISSEQTAPSQPSPASSYADSSPAAGSDSEPVYNPVESDTHESNESAASSPQPTDPTEKNISEQTLRPKSSESVYKDVTLANHTKNYTPDLETALTKRPAIDLVKNGRPQILIVHTHTSESYLPQESATYTSKTSFSSSDQSANIVAVGEVIAARLGAAGIAVIHEKTVFDTDFSNSYSNAAKRIKEILAEYSSIEMVLDIHRDSITQTNGTKIKPTATINGQKAAQVMILTGCNDDGALDFPTWEYNLRTAAQLQQKLNRMYPDLARPIYFVARRYNMHLTKNSLLIEIGTEVNTLAEAKYSANLFSDALIALLDSL